MNRELINAAARGDLETVQELIPVSDSMTLNNDALRVACRHGYAGIIEQLIPVSDPAVVAELNLLG